MEWSQGKHFEDGNIVEGRRVDLKWWELGSLVGLQLLGIITSCLHVVLIVGLEVGSSPHGASHPPTTSTNRFVLQVHPASLTVGAAEDALTTI